MGGYWDDVTPINLENTKDSIYFVKGENHCKIANVEQKISQNENKMLVITFENESGATIRFRIVDGQYKLKMIKNLLTSFGIPFSDCKNTTRWIGRHGVVICKEGKPYNGKSYMEVSHCRSEKDSKADSDADDRHDSQHGNQQDNFDDDIPF